MEIVIFILGLITGSIIGAILMSMVKVGSEKE